MFAVGRATNCGGDGVLKKNCRLIFLCVLFMIARESSHACAIPRIQPRIDTLMATSDRADAPWPPLTVTRRALLVDGSDREFRAFVESLLLLSNKLQEARASIASQMGLTPPQYRIVMTLARAETPEMTATALASTLDVSTAFIVTEAQKLGELGLIKRRKNPDDARSFLIALSTGGRERVVEAAATIQAINDTVFEDFDRPMMTHMTKTTEMLIKATNAALARFRNHAQKSHAQRRASRSV